MQFRCEDLRDYGVVLTPHDSPNFAALRAEITSCIESPPPGGPPPFRDETPELPDPFDGASAILWNGSRKPICAYTFIWKYDQPGEGTRSSRHTGGVGVPSLLLPFGLPEERRAFTTYWSTILPDSKRWLGRETMLGSNADIRPPAESEIWKGGVFRWGGGRSRRGYNSDTVTLSVDAVFFATGECVGQDTHGLWDQIVTAAELHREVGVSVRKGVEAGLGSERIISGVEQIAGVLNWPPPPPPPPPPPNPRAYPDQIRERERYHIAHRVAHMRNHAGDGKTIAMLNSWADAVVPAYRRIP